jgi:division/cell wall cluster transcriptional repressor MraZ
MANQNGIDLRGFARHSLDDKNRVIVPQSLRPKGAREVIVLQHPKAYLAVMTRDQFHELKQHLAEEYPEADQQRDFGLVLNNMARLVPMDGQGRMGLSGAEIEHAGIDREMILTATGSRSQMEIWSPARYAAAVQERRDQVGSMLQKLGI